MSTPKWFVFNYIKINSRKSHILFSENDNASTNISDNTILSENKNKLLGMILDSKLSFAKAASVKMQVKNSMH